MARLVVIDLHFRTFKIPAPPFHIFWFTIVLPVIGPFRLPNIHLRSYSFNIPNIRIPVVHLPIPHLRIDWNRRKPWKIWGAWVPDVRLPHLEVRWRRLTFLGGRIGFHVPRALWLAGGSISWRRIGPWYVGGFWWPRIRWSINWRRVGGQFFRLPTIRTPRLFVRIPNIPRINIPNIDIPTGIRLKGHIDVPNPLTFWVEWGINWHVLRNWLFGWFPLGLIRRPAEWILNTVLTEFVKQLNHGILAHMARIVDAILSVALSRETQEDVREQARRKKPWE